MLQIHGVVVSLLGQFDVAFRPDEDGVSIWRDLKDQFNAHLVKAPPNREIHPNYRTIKQTVVSDSAGLAR